MTPPLKFNMKKLIFCSVLISFLLVSCHKSYKLEWKLDDGEKLIYKTRMEMVHNLSINNANGAATDSSDLPEEMKEIYESKIEQNQAMQYFSFLEKNGDSIDLMVKGFRKQQMSQPKYPVKNFIPSESVYYSGKITPEGTVIDDPRQTGLNYIIAILFGLPEKSLSVGDSWSLDLKNFDFTKKSAINSVTLFDVVMRDSNAIAMLEYKIHSRKKSKDMFVGTIEYKGTAEFNITKGKWEYLEGSLATTNPLYTELKVNQLIELNEVSENQFRTILAGYAQEQSVVETKLDNIGKEMTGKKSDPVKTKKCPVTYGVQILASAEPLPINSKEFKGIPYKIERQYSPKETKFKYKYIVGNECSKAAANQLKKQIAKSGFPEAFIVKR